MKKCKKIVALLLVVAMLTSSLVFAGSAESKDRILSTSTVEEALDVLAADVEHDCKTDCKGDCDYTPVIIVPGIMQSQVYVQNADNTGDLLTVDGFPIVEGMDMAFMFDSESVKQDLKKMILPLLKNLLLGRKDAFMDLCCEIVDKCFYAHYFNEDGTRAYNVQVDEYWYSLEEAKNHPEKSYNYAKGYSTDDKGNTLPTTKYKSEYDFIMRQVDVSSYAEKAGYDHLYYYAYSSFGDTYTIASKFNDFIQMVKDQTGHDKVSVVFISLGGTIGNTYLADFCNPDDIDRIVFAASAVDGSYLLSSLMNADLIFDSDELYTTMLPDLFNIIDPELTWVGYLLNVVVRILPKRLFSGFLTDVFQTVIPKTIGNMLYNCPSMWALVPSGEYKQMADRLIKNETLRAKTDHYWEIQKNAKKTIQKLTEEGMDIFVICGYDLPLPSILSCYEYSSDNIIQTASTSIGATVAPYGETLPAYYKPAIDKSYISPDNKLDAGSAALPDRTWFIKGQSHLTLQSALHDTIELCIQIVINKDITDARTNNGGYPQFNEYRYTNTLEKLIANYEALTEAQLAALKTEDAQALKTAYDNAVQVLDDKNWNNEKEKEAEKALYTALYDADLLTGKKVDSPYKTYELNGKLEKIMKAWSDITNKIFGTKDFVPFI